MYSQCIRIPNFSYFPYTCNISCCICITHMYYLLRAWIILYVLYPVFIYWYVTICNKQAIFIYNICRIHAVHVLYIQNLSYPSEFYLYPAFASMLHMKATNLESKNILSVKYSVLSKNLLLLERSWFTKLVGIEVCGGLLFPQKS